MARDPLAAVALTATPQIQPILGRTDQVRNNADGYVFAKDPFIKAEDFLILGTTGGTFYITEDRLTADNAGWLIQAIQADGTRVMQLITEVSTARPPRAPKNRAAVFALAMVFGPGRKKGLGTSDPGMIGYTLAELRRLLNSLVRARAPNPDGIWSWSGWRRRRQYQARIGHYQRRGHALT